MYRGVFGLSIVLLFATSSSAQYKSKKDYDQFAAGIGLGLDYGGLGGNILVSPHQNVGLFVGGGYTLAGFGYNVGAKISFVTKSENIEPYLIGMYGYNAVVAVPNKPRLDKLFYGPTIGVGLDRDSNRANGYWSYSILFSFVGSSVDDYTNSLKAQSIQFSNNLPPLAFSSPISLSIGYHFVFQ